MVNNNVIENERERIRIMRKTKKEYVNYINLADNADNAWHIQRAVDWLDDASRGYEARWGVGRLEKLIDAPMLDKWQKQWDKFNEAVQVGNVALVNELAHGCVRAWAALESAALASGHKQLAPDCWEAVHPDSGRVYRICKTGAESFVPAAPDTVTYSLEEVIRLLEGTQMVNVVKQMFPGAVVQNIKAPINWKEGDEIPWG